jgi:hypothetical protein
MTEPQPVTINQSLGKHDTPRARLNEDPINAQIFALKATSTESEDVDVVPIRIIRVP